MNDFRFEKHIKENSSYDILVNYLHVIWGKTNKDGGEPTC
jgi:hypothetical protein